MTSPNLTPKQMKILTLIRDTRLSRGYSPTMKELGEALGVSKVTIFEHVEALIKKGCLVRDANKARSLELSPDLELPDEERKTRLPLVGSIAAGSPIEAVETREHLDLEEIFSPPGSNNANKFVLKVRGDSMIDCHIADGDYVICEQRNAARRGDIIVALVDNDEATLKYYEPQSDGTVHLVAANDNYAPIVIKKEQLQIQGVCIGVVRQY